MNDMPSICMLLTFAPNSTKGLRYIPVFVAGTSYAKLHTMPADVSVEPFKAFPKEFHISRITHMAFIACGISEIFCILAIS